MWVSWRRFPACFLLLVALVGSLLLPRPAQAAPPAGALPAGASRGGADRYPVILLPGLGGSELWNGQELVWLNAWKGAQSQIPVLNWLSYDWLLPLRLQADGETPYYPQDRIRVGGTVRIGPLDLYGGFLWALEDQGYRPGQDLFVYLYDWRKDMAAAVPGLGALVEAALARNPGAGKVVLIGHSLGGLIARDYVRRAGGARVAALIGIGTPWLGAALPYKALERGWDLGVRIPGTPWSVRAPRTLHLLVQNYPSIYQLLPGRHYGAVYGGFALAGGRPLPFERARDEVISPHNPRLARAMGYPDTLLDGSDYGVPHYLIAGRGQPTLVAAEQGEWFGLPTWDEVEEDGDDTVPLYSADAGAGRDPQLPARLLGQVAGVAYVRSTHLLLMTSTAVLEQVADWLGAVGGQPARR